jgi:hypothetical protein
LKGGIFFGIQESEPAADENLKSPRATITVTTKKGPSPDDKGGNIGDFEEKPIF